VCQQVPQVLQVDGIVGTPVAGGRRPRAHVGVPGRDRLPAGRGVHPVVEHDVHQRQVTDRTGDQEPDGVHQQAAVAVHDDRGAPGLARHPDTDRRGQTHRTGHVEVVRAIRDPAGDPAGVAGGEDDGFGVGGGAWPRRCSFVSGLIMVC
jgi:hypothetical protein